MKLLLRLFVGIILGGLVGSLGATIGIIAFTDRTWDNCIGQLLDNLPRLVTLCAILFLSIISSGFLHIILHEAGHLVGGLLQGYKFVSFRILSFTLVRHEGKLRWKRFSIAGTGGQCLLLPPNLPLSEIRTGVYNLGGVTANLLTSLLAALPLFLFPVLDEWFKLFLICFTAIGGVMALANGIPLCAGGINNDAYNQLLLYRNPTSKAAIMAQLRINSMIQEGVRPSDIPLELYQPVAIPIDYRDPLQIIYPLMDSARHLDRYEWKNACDILTEAYQHKDHIIGVYANEIACELMFCRLVLGQTNEALALYTKELKAYIEQFKAFTSSKQRVSFAIELYHHKNLEAAQGILTQMEAQAPDYLMQGEVKSDLAIMRYLWKGTSQPSCQ